MYTPYSGRLLQKKERKKGKTFPYFLRKGVTTCSLILLHTLPVIDLDIGISDRVILETHKVQM